MWWPGGRSSANSAHSWVAPAVSLTLLAASSAMAATPDTYLARKAEFVVEGGTVKGFEVASRITYPFPVEEVLDATHDHVHLSERDRDVKLEEVMTTRCTRDLCRINVHVLVGSYFPVGKVAYELDTRVRRTPEGGVLIEWRKVSGSRLIKHLRGTLRLTPAGDEAADTEVDYRLEIAAPTLSLGKVTKKAEAYLQRLGAILEGRHGGHASLWSLMDQAAVP